MTYRQKNAACPIVFDVFVATRRVAVAANAIQHRIHVFIVRLDLKAGFTQANGPLAV